MRYILDHAPDEIASVGGKWDGVGMRYVVEEPEKTAPTSPRSSQNAQPQADQPQVELPIDTPEAGPGPHVESESESESDDAPAPAAPAIPERAVRCSMMTRKEKRCMMRSRQRLPQNAQWDCGRH
jgi:hypothetical protein